MSRAGHPHPIGRPRLHVRGIGSLIANSFRLAWEADSRLLVLAILLNLVRGVATAAQILAVQWLLSGLLGLSDANPDTGAVVAALLTLAALTSVNAMLNAVLAEQQRLLGELTVWSVWERLLDVTGFVELEAYETPTFYDRLQRVQTQAVNRPHLVVQSLITILGGLAGAAGSAIALVAIEPLLLPLVAAAAVPSLVAARIAGRMEFRFAVEQTSRLRLRDYYARTLTGREEAKEVRAFSLAKHLQGRHRHVNEAFLRDFRAHIRRRAVVVSAGGVGASFALAAAVGLIAWFVAIGRLDVAAAGAAVLGSRVLGQQVAGLVAGVQAIAESKPFLDDLDAFFADGGHYGRPDPAVLADHGEARTGFEVLDVCDVSYRYPGSDRAALEGVCLTLRRGEVVALVGENGSGKTTLSKVITGLLPTSGGRVVVDGHELVGATRSALRWSTAMVFQDFVRFEMSGRDNIGMGDVRSPSHDGRVEQAASAAGVRSVLGTLPRGLDTVLSKAFGDGVDLSTGTWQRVAIARAFFRDAPFLVLDEPAAALDARAEHDLFTTLRRLGAGRTVLFISHRLSTARDADRILVLHDGHVVEQGSHDQLMAAGGRYAKMFRLQAASYALAENASLGDRGGDTVPSQVSSWAATSDAGG